MTCALLIFVSEILPSVFLPRYCRFPSSSHLPTSPVLYILFPASNGFPTNFSRVISSLFRYPRASPSPAICNSPATPTGCNLFLLSNTYICVLSIGRPIGTNALSNPPQSYAVTSIAASVGPYKLCNSAFGNFLRYPSTAFLSNASPLQNILFTPLHSPSPCSRKLCSIDGT